MTIQEFFESHEQLWVHPKSAVERDEMFRVFRAMGKRWHGGEEYGEWGTFDDTHIFSNTGYFDSNWNRSPVIDWSDIDCSSIQKKCPICGGKVLTYKNEKYCANCKSYDVGGEWVRSEISKRMFKKGDRVRIRSWDSLKNEYGLDSDGQIPCPGAFINEMRQFCGQEAVIHYIGESFGMKVVSLLDDNGVPIGNDYTITTAMLEHID